MPRPNALLESLGGVSWPATSMPSGSNFDRFAECHHRPDQTYTRKPCSCGRELWPPRGRGRGESLYSPRRVKAKLRALEAFKLRTQGWRFNRIAAHLGYGSAKSAWRAWRRTLDEVTAQRNYEERRRAEGGRPHYPGPTLADAERFRKYCESNERMNDERLDIASERLDALLAEAARRGWP